MKPIDTKVNQKLVLVTCHLVKFYGDDKKLKIYSKIIVNANKLELKVYV